MTNQAKVTLVISVLGPEIADRIVSIPQGLSEETRGSANPRGQWIKLGLIAMQHWPETLD